MPWAPHSTRTLPIWRTELTWMFLLSMIMREYSTSWGERNQWPFLEFAVGIAWAPTIPSRRWPRSLAFHLRRPIARRNCPWRCDTDTVILSYLISFSTCHIALPYLPFSTCHIERLHLRRTRPLTRTLTSNVLWTILPLPVTKTFSKKEQLEKRSYRTSNMSSSRNNASLIRILNIAILFKSWQFKHNNLKPSFTMNFDPVHLISIG
jgi:hypothetical protein